MADVHLPSTLTALFGDLPRRVDVDAPTVADAIAQLEERWPGLRDRLCDNGSADSLRKHIHVYVDRERAELSTALAAGSRVDVIAAISGG